MRLAELLAAPVFSSRQIFPNFPTRHALYCGNYPIAADFETISGLKPDVIFLVGCQSIHGTVNLPTVIQIGPNPTLMGRHYPLDIAAQCELRETLHHLSEALVRLHPSDTVESWPRQRARVPTYASRLIEREEALVREHENDDTIHPSLLEAHIVGLLPRNTIGASSSPQARCGAYYA